MKRNLAPFYRHNFGNVTILWFKKSNKYLVLDDITLIMFDCFLESEDYNHFDDLITSCDTISTNISRDFFFEIETILETLNTLETKETALDKNSNSTLDSYKPNISVVYDFNGKYIEVCYQSVFEQNFIHPQFAYLEKVNQKIEPVCVFHITTINKTLNLFKNQEHLGSFTRNSYHLLQGKFAMELLCVLTHTIESDWLATFHASTVSNNSEAVMLIGESGQGKSTLSTLLMDHGFNLLTDDFTPMLAESQQIQPYPSAISIKKNAFDLIASLSERVQYNTFQSPNSRKGLLKYVTPINFINAPLPCSKIVLVNYKKDSEALLDTLKIEDALNVLIPDSWISPSPEHAKIFMNWLDSCHFYKLTYSNTKEAIAKFESILIPPA